MADSWKDFEFDKVRVSAVLAATWSQYRAHVRYWLTATVCILVPYLVLLAIFDYHAVSQWTDVFQVLLHSKSVEQWLNASQATTGTAGDNSAVVAVLGLLRALVVMPLLFGMLLRLSLHLAAHRKSPSLDESLSVSARRLFAVAVTTVLWWFLWLVVLTVMVFIASLIASFAVAVAGGNVAGVIVASIFALAALVVGIWIAVRCSQTSPIVFTESIMLWSAIRRSWNLTRKQGWRVFWVLVVTFFFVSLVQAAIGLLVAGFVHNPIVTVVVNGIVLVFTSPFSMLAQANLYVHLRSRQGEFNPVIR
ncbi:hypothetical protein [Alicyclobacillus herbarius]|uniref:hypothetical protein n=1 Tax=Alicyclobacillus herbarius TaxID=122960 RepID=UPI00040FFBEE|nr:hypothetical protein [Alicyclobacillus herbarius]